MKHYFGSLVTAAAVLAGLTMVSMAANAQERNGCTAIYRGQAGPPPPGSTAAGPRLLRMDAVVALPVAVDARAHRLLLLRDLRHACRITRKPTA